MTFNIDTYAVIGNPIQHSKSPLIHSLFADQTQQSMEYKAILCPLTKFKKTVAEFIQSGGKGLSVTVPFKQQAYEFADELSAAAKLAKAVNTLSFDSSGKLLGDNTDGVGFLRDLTKNLNVAVQDQKILILGAGGASRGILGPLLAQQPSKLTIVNRTVSKAEDLVAEFAEHGDLTACGYADLNATEFNIIINATSASLANTCPPLPDSIVGENTLAYDLAYATQKTAFQEWAISRGVKVAVDGVGMLVEQAAEAFKLWRGIYPETKQIIQQITTD